MRFGSAECVALSVRTHLRCDGNAGCVDAACKGPLFHNGPQSLWSHAVVEENVRYGGGKMSQ